MVAKRRLDFSKVTDMPVSKRVKRLEAKVKAQRPEMRTLIISINVSPTAGTLGTPINLTSLLQGDGVANRSGTRIKVWRVEIRGFSHAALDNYLIQLHGTTIPVLGTFSGGTGSFIASSENNTRFTEWLHHPTKVDDNVIDRFKMTQKFPRGITVKYDGNTAAPVDNGLYFCVLNRSGTTRTVDATCCIWFTDA